MNFQNLPARTEAGLAVKRAFVPRQGAFSYFDYQQIEPRLFAFFVAKGLGDDTVVNWFREGRDFYTEIAAQLFEKPESEITPDERHVGKNLLFLPILYSAGPRRIATDNNISLTRAREMYNQFHENIPWVRALSNPAPSGYRPDYVPGLIERTLQRRKSRQNPEGYLTAPWGRHLHPEEWGAHKMLNKLIQGSAADLMKLALIRTHEYIKADPDMQSRLVLTVHDEIDIDGPEHELPWLHEVIPPLMTDFPEITEWVPLGTDHEVSTTNMAEKVAYEEWLATQEVAVA